MEFEIDHLVYVSTILRNGKGDMRFTDLLVHIADRAKYRTSRDYALGENGVSKDPARSFYWFSKSAAQGLSAPLFLKLA